MRASRIAPSIASSWSSVSVARGSVWTVISSESWPFICARNCAARTSPLTAFPYIAPITAPSIVGLASRMPSALLGSLTLSGWRGSEPYISAHSRMLRFLICASVLLRAPFLCVSFADGSPFLNGRRFSGWGSGWGFAIGSPSRACRSAGRTWGCCSRRTSCGRRRSTPPPGCTWCSTCRWPWASCPCGSSQRLPPGRALQRLHPAVDLLLRVHLIQHIDHLSLSLG